MMLTVILYKNKSKISGSYQQVQKSNMFYYVLSWLSYSVNDISQQKVHTMDKTARLAKSCSIQFNVSQSLYVPYD